MLLMIALPMAKLSAQVSTWDGTWEPWTHGTGTEADPFLIENAQQLAYLAYRVNNGLDAGGGHVSNHDYHYKMMIDVNLNGSNSFQWTSIGYWNSNFDYQSFGGHFDGNNHTISRLYINNSANRVGFFAYTEGAIIKNLAINGTKVFTSGDQAGGVIGFANGTTIMNCCTNFEEGVSASRYVGGIVGFSEDVVTITNCHNTGTVSATTTSYSSYSGGILGHAGTATIINCYNTGTASATATNSSSSYSYSGGILGQANTAIVTQCYNTGIASATTTTYSYDSYSYSGGVIGQADTATITNCYNTGTVSDSLSVSNPSFNYSYSGGIYSGGILGQTDMATITNCYNTGTVSIFLYYSVFGGEEGSGGGILGYKNNGTVINSYYRNTSAYNNNYGGQPMSADAMQTQDFVDLLNNGYCAWEYDYNNMNNGYPVLTMVSYSAETYDATEITSTSSILHGSVSTMNTNVVSKGFEYRKLGDAVYSNINITDNSDYFSYNLSGLSTNTTYEYRTFLNVVDCDITSYGDIKTFTLSLLNNDTICIHDADMLRWVSEQCNSGTTFEGYCIKLMNDIMLPINVPNNMTSIGTYPDYPFKGTFDGNGKLIHNLYIDQPNTPYQGFFGYTLNANLYNVGLVNITASGRNYTGGMVAYAKNTHLRDCYVNDGTLFALSYCGGLVGYQEQGTNSIVSGCYNTCSVSGNHYVGGLIGFSNYSTVRNSYVAGSVSGQGNGIGAIIGGANEVLMYYCYFSIEMTGQTNAIGENNIGGGKDGGEGLTNAQMRDPQFVATLNQDLMTPVWMADYASHINNGFPIIKWQRPGTSVEENNAVKNYIFLYPNPANDFVTIQSDDPSVSLKQLEVYDVTGRKVMSETLFGQNQGLNIAKLHEGIYHFRIQTDNGCYTNLKLVVQ